MGHRGRAALHCFIKKLFGKKDIKPIQKQKQIKMKKLKLFPILKELKKRKRTTDITTNTKNLEERKY